MIIIAAVATTLIMIACTVVELLLCANGVNILVSCNPSYEVGAIIHPISEMRKWRQREVK